MLTFGIIIGNRGFFPAHLCQAGRREILKALETEGIRAVALPEEATKFGAVESLADARQCADLFQTHRGEIDGVLVTLPNFGDERAVANTLRWAGLNVPVLIHAFNDDAGKMTSRDRRDSFCGKMSVCNNLRQYGIPYSLTKLHTVDPHSPNFTADLRAVRRHVQRGAETQTCAHWRDRRPARRVQYGAVQREIAGGRRYHCRNVGFVRSPRLGPAPGG